VVKHVDEAKKIVYFTLSRPKKGNSLSLLLLDQFQEHLTGLEKEAKASPNTVPKVAIIRSEGGIFCAGHDLKEMLSLYSVGEKAQRKETFLSLFRNCNNLMVSINRSPLIFIAQVNGIATAAGCQLVSACDLVVATKESTFATPGVNIGLFCSTPSVAISRSISQKRLMEMLLTGKPIDATTALQYGLINRAVSKDTLEQTVEELALEIASKPARVLALGKNAFYAQKERRSLHDAYEFAGGIMAENLLLEETKEGITAFLEKRKPKW
jgi:enoyl-CoA hydratase/carnithine racemase